MLTKETYNIQAALAGYCRTGELPQLPGLTPNRVQQYRRLVYNVIDDTFQGAFPITYNFLTAEEWEALVNDFFSHHTCRTPSVWKLPFELYEYVSKNEPALKIKYPFITDLLYFEWLEIEVHTMPDEPVEEFKSGGNWLKDRLILNKEFRLVRLGYPVHQHKPSELVEKPGRGDYFALIFREPGNGNVQFFNLSPLYAFIVSQLAGTQNNLDFIISQTCSLFNIERNEQVEQNIESFLEQMKQKQFVFGFAAAS